MSYTSGNLAAWGIARCSRGRNRNVSWLSVSYVTLVAAVTFLVGLSADAISVDVLVAKHHTPYDKIFILNFIIDNISSSDTPRFTIEIMEKELALLKEVLPADLEEYNDPLTAEDIEEELQMWRDYIDTEHFSNFTVHCFKCIKNRIN